jgi:four helix bundle protein
MFEALEVSLAAVEALRGPAKVIRAADGDLYRQIRRAGSSLPLTVAEGGRRVGKDRKHLWRVAAGSAAEVRVALRTAVAWGDLDAVVAERPLALLDRVLAMLWKMTR